MTTNQTVTETFTFEDMKKISRSKLGNSVPIELYRAIRLIGMYQGLPMKGRATTMTLGRKIGESLPISSAEELLDLFRELKIGDPEVVSNDGNKMHIVVNDCFCEGLPEITGNLVCDL